MEYFYQFLIIDVRTQLVDRWRHILIGLLFWSSVRSGTYEHNFWVQVELRVCRLLGRCEIRAYRGRPQRIEKHGDFFHSVGGTSLASLGGGDPFASFNEVSRHALGLEYLLVGYIPRMSPLVDQTSWKVDIYSHSRDVESRTIRFCSVDVVIVTSIEAGPVGFAIWH